MGLETPQKDSWDLLELRYGDPQAPFYARYTNRAEDVLFMGGTYLSDPRMRIEYPPQDGTLAKQETKIVLPKDSFTELLSAQGPFSRVHVKAWEQRASTTRQNLSGTVFNVSRNKDGKTNQVGLVVVTWREMLGKRLGFQEDAQCVWTFGGAGCGVDLGPITQVGTVDMIDGPEVFISGLAAPPPLDPDVEKWWHRGSVGRDGVKLLVRDWDPSQPMRFLLVTEPPASWVSAAVTCVPGCDKRAATCELRHNNLDNHMGLGVGISAHNPVIEIGP